MKITPESAVGRIVLDYPMTAGVFETCGIDFCCNGNKTLSVACKEKGLAIETVLVRLEEQGTISGEDSPDGKTDFRSWPLDRLADHIEKKHHRYVQENLPVLSRYLEKILGVHGQAHPELAQITAIFGESAGELTKHMKKEELILFPFIRKLIKMKEKGERVTDPSAAGAVEHPISMMMHDHDAEGERFRKIAELSGNYTPPADSCATYQAAYSKLKEFEKDLHQHIHLENNLLFPGAIEAEKQLIH